MQGRGRAPLRQLDARRVGLLKPSALGDIVHSLPVLTALRRRFPGATLTWIVNRSYEPLLAGHPDLDETLAFDRGAARSGFGPASAPPWRRTPTSCANCVSGVSTCSSICKGCCAPG
jgi:hypothetical protein